ncbi:hypothetical protein K461DRAFT_266568 [Myriangium duriaei CBS 260.36]|uniref:Swi5-dependent recombination DNA repair protein 1 n=1 Tax=Myriangium duriaei CBS 260.36 TaxID=1168546 RepID=A0A9P4MJJ0_9PEZI|nr:hypothetical protein K461DRAFT_266568 [Myriangium duriaei CBS 260.36]
MTTPLAKRRRIDGTSGVNKPFRSPLRTAPPPTPTLKHNGNNPSKPSQLSRSQEEQPLAPALPSPAATQPTTQLQPQTRHLLPSITSPDPVPEQDREIPDSDSEAATPLALPSSPNHPTPCTPYQSSVKAPPSSPTRPSIRELTDIKALEDQIALLQSHPCFSIRRDTNPVTLKRLTDKWARAARDAAEILLPVMRERQSHDVLRGTRAVRRERDEDKHEAWKEAVKERERMLEAGVGEGGETMGAVEKGRVEGEVKDLKRLIAMGEEAEDQEEETGDVGFGMGELLKVLGVRKDVLGWDDEKDEWRE